MKARENTDQFGRKLPLEGHKEECPHGKTGWAKCTCEETLDNLNERG